MSKVGNKFGNMADKMIKSYSDYFQFIKFTSESKNPTSSTIKKQFNFQY